MKKNPAATWIIPSGEGSSPAAFAFTLRFTETSARVRKWKVTADQRYVLFLDGVRLGRGPERGDAANWYEHSHVVRLKRGEHVLAALVWHLGAQAPLAQVSLGVGFYLDDGGDLATGVAAWRVKRLPGYRFVDLGRKPPGFYAVGADLEISGEACRRDLLKGGGIGWQKARLSETPGPDFAPHGEASTGHLLRPAVLPAMREKPAKPGCVRFAEGGADVRFDGPLSPNKNDAALVGDWQKMLDGSGSVKIPPRTDCRVLVDLQDYFCAYPELRTAGGKGAAITLRWAESLHEDADHHHKGNRAEIAGKYFSGVGDRFLPDGGRDRTMETLWWRAGRYLMFEIRTEKSALEIKAFRLSETRYPLEPQSRFASDEPRLRAVHRIGIRTLQMCSHETYMDCPYYEQLMYAGDTRLEMLTHYTLARDARLQAKAISLFDASRDGTGLTASRYPCSLRQVIPPFSLWWIHCVHDHALWRGNSAFISGLLPGVRAVLEHFAARRDDQGLVRGLRGWNFVDWVGGWDRGMPPGTTDSSSCTIQWQMVLALDAAAEMENWFSEPLLSVRWSVMADELAAAITRVYWDARRGIFTEDAAHRIPSEHAQALAVLSGRLSVAQRKSVRKALASEAGLAPASIYFSHYVLEALRDLGDSAGWFRRLEYWFSLEKDGFVTTPEAPEGARASRSDCHAWGAHPVYHSYATLLGIRPASPGFATVKIAPFPGPLRRLRGSLVHPQGTIRVELNLDSTKPEARVSLPGTVTGEFIWKKRSHSLVPGEQRIDLAGG